MTDNKENIVTAKHLFKRNTKTGDSIFVSLDINKKLTKFKAKVYFHPNALVDVAVLRIDSSISKETPIALGFGGQVFLGQQCIFLGFPIFNLGAYTKNEKIPLVKRAIVSAFYEKNGINIWLLDGHNNSGFSGGPIVSVAPYDKMDNQFIAGIISGYINENKKMSLKDGKGVESELSLNDNSGIIISYPSKYILETISTIKN